MNKPCYSFSELINNILILCNYLKYFFLKPKSSLRMSTRPAYMPSVDFFLIFNLLNAQSCIMCDREKILRFRIVKGGGQFTEFKGRFHIGPEGSQHPCKWDCKIFFRRECLGFDYYNISSLGTNGNSEHQGLIRRINLEIDNVVLEVFCDVIYYLRGWWEEEETRTKRAESSVFSFPEIPLRPGTQKNSILISYTYIPYAKQGS